VLWLGETDQSSNQLIMETQAKNDLFGQLIDPKGPATLKTRYFNMFLNTPVVLSTNAGNHYCNRALYEMLRIDPPKLCVFVHVPRCCPIKREDLMQVYKILEK